MAASKLNSFNANNIPVSGVVVGSYEDVSNYSSINVSVIITGSTGRLYIYYTNDITQIQFVDYPPIEILDSTPITINSVVKSKYLLVKFVTWFFNVYLLLNSLLQ